MSDPTSINTQTQPAAPVTPAGPSVEEVKAQLQAEFDRTREGLIRDLQQERSRRQELEQRLQPPAPSPAQPDVSMDELGKVLDPYNRPIRQAAEEALKTARALQSQLGEERAKSVLSARTGKKWEDIEADKGFQERLTSVVQRYKLIGTPDDLVGRAYDIMELEDLKTKEVERVRSVKAAQQASMPSGSAPAPVVDGKEYSVDEFNKMHWKEFDSLSSKGGFKKVGDKFIYTPRS